MLFLESSIPRANRRAFAFFSLKPYGLALIVKWDTRNACQQHG